MVKHTLQSQASVIPEAVLRAMHRASPNIYEGELVDLTHTLVPDLRYVAQTEGNVALYIANGHGAWEAALANMACHGDRVLVAATGGLHTVGPRWRAPWGLRQISLNTAPNPQLIWTHWKLRYVRTQRLLQGRFGHTCRHLDICENGYRGGSGAVE